MFGSFFLAFFHFRGGRAGAQRELFFTVMTTTIPRYPRRSTPIAHVQDHPSTKGTRRREEAKLPKLPVSSNPDPHRAKQNQMCVKSLFPCSVCRVVGVENRRAPI